MRSANLCEKTSPVMRSWAGGVRLLVTEVLIVTKPTTIGFCSTYFRKALLSLFGSEKFTALVVVVKVVKSLDDSSFDSGASVLKRVVFPLLV